MKNKKIGKFRKWLIKLLGGISPDEKIQPIIIEHSFKPITIEKSAIANRHTQNEEILHDLKNELLKELEQYICVVRYDDVINCNAVYKARITLMENKNDV